MIILRIRNVRNEMIQKRNFEEDLGPDMTTELTNPIRGFLNLTDAGSREKLAIQGAQEININTRNDQ